MNRTAKLYIVLAVTIFIWGSSFVIVDMAIEDGSSPTMLAMARFLVGSSIFGAYLLWRKPQGVKKPDMRTFLILAFIGIGVYYIFQYYGIKWAGPTVSVILVTLLCPVMIFAFTARRLKEGVTRAQKAGLGVSAVGSVMVITDGTLAIISDWQQILGGLFGVVCALFWAVYTVEGKQLVKRYDPIASTAYITLMGTVMLAPFAVADFAIAGGEYPLSFFLCAIYLGVLCTVVGYVFWFRALTGLEAYATGASLYFEPVVTLFVAYMLLGEGIGIVAGLGSLITLVGVVLVSRR